MSIKLGLLASSQQQAAPFISGDACYSLVKSNVSYTGSCIRVRRSSDNAEQDIGFVGSNLDLVSLNTFIGVSNGFIRTWYDQSINSFNATQTTTANQPQITTLGDILFDGTNDNLSLGANVFVKNITFNSSGTWELWIKPVRNNQVILGISDNNATGLGYLIRGDLTFTNIRNTSNSNQFWTPALTLNTWQNIVISFDISTNLIKIYKNGISQVVNQTALGAGAKFTDIAQTLFLGFNQYNGGSTFNYYSGNINECNIYKSILTDAQVLSNYNATKSKYGL